LPSATAALVGLALVLSLLPASGAPLSASAASVPNDPYYADYQWNLRQIRAPEAWDLTTGDRRVVIAIVDTGIALDHPDLIDKLVPGINLVTPGAPPADDNGHGTHMAGIAAAATNNGVGVAGVSWEARLMPVKVLDQTGGGDVNRVAQGITWAVDHGARVINLSFDGPDPSQALADAVQYARGKGALVVAAVGNEGRADPTYPAALDGVMAVAATDRNDQRLASSNTGSYVSVAAPGQDIPSTYWDPSAGNTYALASTSSQGAPHVAGLAGLIWSVNPDLSGDAVRQLIENHADDVGRPGRDDETGFGRINAYRALQAALPWNYDSSGATAYRAPAEAAQRLYLPYVVKGSDGWTSTIALQNPTDQAVTLTVTFIGPTGSVVTAVGAGLSPQGATILPLQLLSGVPAGFQGTAVIDASGRLAAVVAQDHPGSSRHSYVGVTSGAPRLYAPLVQRGGRRGSTTLYVQNLGDQRETAQVTYYTPAGAVAALDTVPLPPRAAAPLRLADSPNLPDGFTGAAVVESANGGPLGAVAAQIGSSGEARGYTLPADPSVTLAAPLAAKNAGGWSTGIQVLNAGTAQAQVSVTYSPPAAPRTAAAVVGTSLAAGAAQAAAGPLPPSQGQVAPQEAQAVPPRGSATFYQPANPALPDDYTGAAVLGNQAGSPLVAVVNQVRAESNLMFSYTAAPSGAPTLYLPLVAKDYAGWTSTIRVQNLAADAADVTIAYHDQAGRAVATAQDTLPAGGSATYQPASVAALPWGFIGTATLTSNNRPLAAVVEQLKPAP